MRAGGVGIGDIEHYARTAEIFERMIPAEKRLQYSALGVGTATPTTNASYQSETYLPVTIDNDATPDQVTVEFPAGNAPAGRIFARLVATLGG